MEYLYIYDYPIEPTAQRWNDETIRPEKNPFENPFEVPTVTWTV